MLASALSTTTTRCAGVSKGSSSASRGWLYLKTAMSAAASACKRQVEAYMFSLQSTFVCCRLMMRTGGNSCKNYSQQCLKGVKLNAKARYLGVKLGDGAQAGPAHAAEVGRRPRQHRHPPHLVLRLSILQLVRRAQFPTYSWALPFHLTGHAGLSSLRHCQR